MKKIKYMILSLFLIVTMVGCSAEKEEAVEQKVEFWTISLQPVFTEYFEEEIKLFKEENPDVEVVWKDYPYDALQNNLLTAISSGDIPDVVNINAEMAQSMGKKGALSNVDDYFSKEQIDAYIPGIYAASQSDGKTLAVPWYTTSPVMFVNKEILDDIGMSVDDLPTDFEEYIAWAEKVKEKSGKYATTVVPDIRHTLLTNGVDLFNDDMTEAKFNSEDAIEIMEGYKKLVQDEVAPKDVGTMEAQVQMFASEEIVSAVVGTSFINALETSAPDVYEKTIAVPVPYNNSISSSMFLTVPEGSKNKELAYEFIDHLANAEGQLKFSKESNTLPSTLETMEDAFFATSDGSLEEDARVAAAKSLLKAVEYPVDVELLDEMNVAIQNILLNNKDVKEELDTAAEAVNSILSK